MIPSEEMKNDRTAEEVCEAMMECATEDDVAAADDGDDDEE